MVINIAAGQILTIKYTNWKGETAARRISPVKLWLGSNEWHPDTQWLLDAFDLDMSTSRTFALRGIEAIE